MTTPPRRRASGDEAPQPEEEEATRLAWWSKPEEEARCRDERGRPRPQKTEHRVPAGAEQPPRAEEPPQSEEPSANGDFDYVPMSEWGDEIDPIVSYTADSRASGPRFHAMSSYAIISLGGKQYRVQEGERLLVDRLRVDEGSTLEPRVLLVGGDGAPDLAPSATVTARVVGHELGKKIRIGKYRRRTGYKRHTGHRSKLTRIEIESIGAAKRAQGRGRSRRRTRSRGRGEAGRRPSRQAATGPDVRLDDDPGDHRGRGRLEPRRVEAALEAERSGKARKGALAALESALEDKMLMAHKKDSARRGTAATPIRRCSA